MNKKEYKNFIKRYEKFSKNNLPTPFWDEERQTLEYVYFVDKKYYNHEELVHELEVSPNLIDALADISKTGLYYSFTDKHLISYYDKDNNLIIKTELGHSHAHSFEEVVKALYYSPESFKVSKEEEIYYSKQELEYLSKVQRYLLFIGLKDVENYKIPVSRYRNKKQRKYQNAFIRKLNHDDLEQIINNNRKYLISKWYPEYKPINKSKKDKSLIIDEDNNFIMFIEYTKEEIKEYREIKDIYQSNEYKDTDKVIVSYIKILEKYNKRY